MGLECRQLDCHDDSWPHRWPGVNRSKYRPALDFWLAADLWGTRRGCIVQGVESLDTGSVPAVLVARVVGNKGELCRQDELAAVYLMAAVLRCLM